jgi:hypothetical protein
VFRSTNTNIRTHKVFIQQTSRRFHAKPQGDARRRSLRSPGSRRVPRPITYAADAAGGRGASVRPPNRRLAVAARRRRRTARARGGARRRQNRMPLRYRGSHRPRRERSGGRFCLGRVAAASEKEWCSALCVKRTASTHGMWRRRRAVERSSASTLPPARAAARSRARAPRLTRRLRP